MSSNFSFPEMTPAQIAEALHTYGLAPAANLRPEDIANPQPDLLPSVLSLFLASVVSLAPFVFLGGGSLLKAGPGPARHGGGSSCLGLAGGESCWHGTARRGGRARPARPDAARSTACPCRAGTARPDSQLYLGVVISNSALVVLHSKAGVVTVQILSTFLYECFAFQRMHLLVIKI